MVERAHAQLPTVPPGAGIVIAPVGLPGMWHHMTKQLQQLGLAVVLPGVDSPLAILDLVEQLRPSVLISLPLVLSRLAELSQSRGGASLHPEAQVFTGGDVLSEARRSRLASLWGAPVTDYYGISEVFGPLATRDSDSSTMYWQAPEVAVEIHDHAGRNVEPGETGVAVISTQWRRPAQLVRYWTGDCFRLIRWIQPGVPAFEMRGREGRVAGLRAGSFVVDVDEVLLADPAVLNEWKMVQEDTGGFVLQIEATGQIAGDTERLLDHHFEAPPRIDIVEPGSLDRSLPKLGVAPQF